jgi:hypothetical protein
VLVDGLQRHESGVQRAHFACAVGLQCSPRAGFAGGGHGFRCPFCGAATSSR